MAGSAVVGILRVLLSADTAEYEAAMKKVASSADAMSKDLKSLGQQATNVGSTLTKALTLPIVGLGAASIKSAMDFESSFAGIRKTVDGVVDSSGNLTAAGKEMQQAMRDLAKTIPVNVNDLNRLGEAAGALGVPRDKVVDFASVMAKLGVTTNLTADQAADAIARIQNIFGAAGKDTDRLASTLVALGNAGASTEKEIVEMAQRISGAGHSVGLTQAQVLAFASTLASVGINAEAGGSAISKVFLKINDAVAKGGGGLAEFARVSGMSAAQFKKAFETDAASATQKFIEGLARLKTSGENVNGTIEGLVGKNIILKDTLLRVSGAGQLLNDQLKLADQAWRDNTALTKEAEQRFKTTEAQLTLLWNRIKDVGITLGNALLPGINAAIQAINGLLPLVAGLADAFGRLPGAAQALILGLGLVAAAAGPVIYAFGQIAISASGLIGLFGKKGLATKLLASELIGLGTAGSTASTAFGLIGSALGVLASPVALAIAGIGLLAVGVYKVATAETDLEKALRVNSSEFGKHTDAIAAALRTYEDLRSKQHLTTEETRSLDVATRTLAEASGLSTQAFDQQARKSSALTDALRLQIAASRDLQAEEVKRSHEALASTEAALNQAKKDLEAVRSGTATKAETSGGTGGGGVFVRDLTAAERIKEIERLTGQIAQLTVGVQKARDAYQQLLPPLSAAHAAIVDKSLGTAADEARSGWQGVAGVFINGVVPALRQTSAGVKDVGADVSALAALTATYASDLKKIGAAGFREIQQAHEKFGLSVKDLSEKYGVAASSIDYWIGKQKAATKETKDANAELTAFTKKADQLEGDLQRAAKAGVPMTIVLEEFGSQIKDVTNKAPLFGKAVGDATKAAAEALKSSTLAKAAEKLIESLNDQARSMVAKWKKAGEDSAEAAAVALAKGNKKFLADIDQMQRDLVGLEKDSLSKRQRLIEMDFDQRRSALDKYETFYEQKLAILNAQEAKALRESGQTWEKEQRDKVTASLDALGQSFGQLAQISGGCFGDVAKDIGTTIASMALARRAVDGLRDSFKEIKGAFAGGDFDFSGFASGLAHAVGSALAAGAALMQATDPRGKNTAQTVVGGALVGGQIGDSTGIPGAGLVGMGLGALTGWWRSAHAEWKKVKKQIISELGHDFDDISQEAAQKIADLEATLTGGTKGQRREWAIALSLPDLIADDGGLKIGNLQKYEREASNLFEIIQRGGADGAKATETLNTLIGQFAGQADKAGGMWDATFKDLIAQSKALGINIDAITAAIDKQIGKLSGGLGAAAKGAFSGSDKTFADLTKNLNADQIASLTDPAKRDAAKLPAEIAKQFDALVAGTQGAFDRLSRTALASFNAIVASGRSAFEAIQQIGPAIDLLIAQHDKLGLAGGAAYDQLARFRNLTKDNADLVASVGGLNDTLTALANLGGLNADVLADLEAQGLDTFAKLQAAGFTENEALQQMVPFLENVLKAHKDLGLPIDENTQKLIDQAEAQGLLSDEAMSTNDILLEGFRAIIEAVGGKVPAAFDKMARAARSAGRDAKDAIDSIPRDVEIKVRTRNDGGYDGSGINPHPGPIVVADPDPRVYGGTGEEGRYFALGGVAHTQYAATGKTIGRLLNFTPKGSDTVPAMLTPGEGVLNLRAMQNIGGASAVSALNSGWMMPAAQAAGQAGAAGAAGAVTLSVTIAINNPIANTAEQVQNLKRVVETAVVDVLRSENATNALGVKTIVRRMAS